ncbi:MAG: hypothetical protein KJP00_03865 [Bacteroidia bacterium]|nr:hypothetical protein [Bacteroidia bacterium]
MLYTLGHIAAQDRKIDGYWSGELTQNEGGFVPNYIFEVYIQSDGNDISGEAIVSTPDSLSAKMLFKGKFHQGGFLKLKEYEIKEATTLMDQEWCLKTLSLFLKKKDDEYFLIGFWTGVSRSSVCIPGKIKLRRRAQRV